MVIQIEDRRFERIWIPRVWTPIFHHIHTRVGVQIPNRWLERKLILIGSRKRSRFAFCALASDERKINMILKKYTTSAVRLNQQHSTLGNAQAKAGPIRYRYTVLS